MMISFFYSIQNEKQQMGDKKPKEASQKDLRELTEANHRG